MHDTIPPSMTFAAAGKRFGNPESATASQANSGTQENSGTSRSPTPLSVTAHRQLRALLWLLLCWSIGTLLWESIAWGGEDHLFSQRWREQETATSVTHSAIPEFYRLDKNRRMRAVLLQAIQTEEAIWALKRSKLSWKPVPARIETDPDALVVDPIIDMMFATKQRWIDDYRRLDEVGSDLLLSHRAADRLLWDTAVSSSLPGLMRLISSRLEADGMRLAVASTVTVAKPETKKTPTPRKPIYARAVGFRMPRAGHAGTTSKSHNRSTTIQVVESNPVADEEPQLLRPQTRILEVTEPSFD